MKRSKRKSDSCSHVESEKAKESSISRKTREKYHKEIVEHKETRRIKTREVQNVSDLHKPADVNIKNDKVSDLNKPGEEDITNKEDDNSKFSELRKYLLSDLSGKNVKNSSPVKKEVVSEKNKSLKKETMLDTIDESNQTPMKHTRSAKSNSVEKADKKSLSPSKKLSSSVVKSDANSMETLGNAKQKSPRKRLKQTPSPERLSVVTPESPRIGSRQRSPNLRYADDMVMFPLKSPTKRQIFKKENSTPENMNNNDAAPPKTSQSTECQTSQLYSLLTGTVKTVNVQRQASQKNSRSKESGKLEENKITLKMESDEKSNVDIKKDTDIDNVVANNENEPCEPSDGNLDGENAVKTEVTEDLSHEQIKKEGDEISEGKTVNVFEDRGEQKDSNKPASSKLSDTDKKDTDLNFLHNLTEVIDQIRVESTQEEMPEWAVYKSKPPKIRRVRKRKPLGQMTQFKIKTALHELQHDSEGGGDIGYTVIEKPLGTPMSSGDEDDLKGKRRTTKPISKRSIIRMSPALGLLVGHDEDGFTMLNDKKTMSDSEDNAKDGVTDGKPKLKSKLDDKKQRNSSKVKKEINNVDRKPAVNKSAVKSVSGGLTSSTQSVASVSMATATQSQLKVLGNAGLIGTKATIVSGSQTLPCVLVSSASTLKPQTLLNLPLQSINSQGSFIIPANRISLIGSVGAKSSPLTVVSPPTTVMSPIMPVNIPLSTSVRPSAIQVVTPVQQPISVLRAPKLKAGPVPESSFFRLSSDGQLISSVEPLASTTVRTSTTNQVSGAFVSTTSGVGVVSSGKAIISNPPSINLPLKSKVLILKKADIPCSAGQIIVSSPSTSGIRPGMSLLRKLPVTTSSSTQSTQGSIVATSKAEKIEDNKIESVKKSVEVEEQEQQALIPLNNLISKVKTNMNSLMELPECLVAKTFVDSIMINEEYESESESNSEEETAGEKGDIMMETDVKDSSSDVKVSTQSLTESDEPISKNEKTETFDESPSNHAEEMKNQDEHVNNEKSDQEKDETQQKDCHNELKSSEHIEGDKIKSIDDVQIDSSETKIENQEALPKSGKEESDDKNNDVVKEPNISLLENKLKKAMESLSVIAAKTESSKLVKHDLKTESRSQKGKEQVIGEKVNSVRNETDFDDLKGTSPNKTMVSDQGGKLVPMESESLCGSNSESEESGKRRNIFDVIMEDYQSPSKEGNVADKDGDKFIVDIQDSPKKKSDDVVQDGLKTKSDRTLFDIGVTPKPKTETDGVQDEDRMISEENRGNKISKDADEISVDNNMTEDKEAICQVDNSLQHLEHVTLNRSNKSEFEEEISDENIKIQKKDELNAEDSTPKILTMADKLLAKFKEIDDDESESQTPTCKSPGKLESNVKIVVIKSPVKLESGVKTTTRSPVKIEKIGNKSPFSKPPIKLKICSSPDKSFTKCIVATSDVSNNMTTARPVPKMSTQQEIKKPLPMNILTKPEQEVKDKLSAFSSPALESFLQKQTVIDNEADGEEDDDDDEEDENINEIDYDDDSDVSMDEHEPDFDEIDGVLFMSFPSKNALKAHVQVERRTKLGTDENLLLGMTRMRNMRRKQGYIMSKYNKKVGNKFFKDQDNINQNLRGMHKTLAKYQRLYKQELYWLQNPDDDATMSKTNDITKIKGWKNKVGNVTDDVELAKAEIENGGKLHWRTEARLAKNLRPDELKEYGLNIKKKRRKNMIYTQRKGMSKGDRSQRAENDPDELDDSRSNSNDFDEHVEYIDDENEPKDNQEVLPEIVDIDGVVVFDPDDDVQDEELIKINERELLKENETRKNTERHRMFIKAQMLKKRLGYNLRDIQVIRKLGGHNIRRRKNAGGIYEGDYIVMDNSSRPSTPDPSQSEETEKETPQKKNRKPKIELHMTVLTSNMVSATCTALPKQFIRKKPSRPHVKETDTPTKSPEPEQSTTCDKPGCRYSCICHLCVFTEQSPEADDKTIKCEKEYCRLGCICDSIEARKERDKKSHCGKPECIMECECAYENTKRAKKDDEDYHFKKNSKFAALPRRESTYRLAKNLDAVSRKAMLLYESSEMFAEQKVKRRKSKETTTTAEPAPQVYIDVDYDDFEMDHRVSTVPSKSRKQEFSPQINPPLSLHLKPVPVPHKPVEIKPKPKNRTEMTDFSNIKSEISSQGSWNLSDLSDEYEDIDVISDKDSEFTTCARTTLYKAVKRDHHLAGCVCNCGRKSDNLDGLGCNADAKFNIPDDILSSGKWHTQWICLRSKGQSFEEADRGGLRLLEVISNCNYEDSKTRILSRLTSHISKDTYPILKSFIIGEFQVTFLPRSDKPAVIPPEVKAKLPNSVFSIRIQIVKDPGASNESPKVVINLVCDENDKDQLPEKRKKIYDGNGKDQLPEKRKKRYDGNGKDQLPEKQKKVTQFTNLVNPGTSVGQSELAKHLISNEKLMESVPSTSSCSSIVPGSISGLSRLQITRPRAPLTIVPVIGNQNISSPCISVHHSEPKPGNHINSTALSPLNQLGGQVVDTITSSQSINILTSGVTTTTTVTNTDKFQTLSGCIPKGISMQAPQNTLINSVLKPSSQSVPISSYSVLGTYSNLEIARNKLSDIVKNNMVQPNIGQADPQNLKRKISEELLVPDPKKSKIENVSSPIQSVPGSNIVQLNAPPVPSVNKDSDNSIGQISVLRCVRCNMILTAEDITSWVLSQESVQEKICVKCRIGKKQIANIQVKLVSTTQCTSSSPPVVIDVDEPTASTDHVIKSELETVKKDCVKTSGGKTKTMHYITEQVEEYSLQLDCEDGKSLEIVPNKKSTESKEEKASLKQVIDLDSDNECIAENSKPSKDSLKPTIDLDNDNECIAENAKPSKTSLKPTIGLDNGNECIAENSKPSKRKYDEVTKVVESIPGSASEIEQEDELEAAIRDAQDDYDNIMRNLSDGNESQESDDQNDLTSMKGNVIVIDDDDDDDDVDVLKRKSDKVKSDEPVAKRSNMQSSNDEEDVDVLTFSEHDVIDVSSFVGSNLTISPWHNSSCSVHNNLLRKKRKVQHDLIDQNIGEMDIKEGTSVDYEARKKESLKQKKIKARKMRTEMQQIYNEISEIVMTEKEWSTVSKNWNNSSTQPKILDKAVRYIRTEVPRIAKLQAKIMAFQQYQVKLKRRLNELKEYHTERGISKDKLDFQLEKIAVVCDRIYEHLPEIKKHIKNKKEGQESTPTSSPAIPPAKTGKPSKQTKKSKSATSKKHQSAEIYIDNPEEYNDEAQINQSATPLVSLPGNYVKVVPGQIQMVSASQMTNIPIKPVPVLSLSGSSSIQPTSVVNKQGTSVAGKQMPGLQGPNTRLPETTGTLGLQGPNIGTPNVRISFPLSDNILGSNTIAMNMAPVNMDGVQKMTKLSGTINYTIPVRPPGSHVPIATVQGGHIQPNILQPSAAKSNVNLPPTSFGSVASSPGMAIQNVAMYPPTSVQTSSSELSNILNAPPGQNLGQHPSTSAFSEVIGQMIKKNIVEHSSLNDASTENTQTLPDSQNKNKFSEGYMPPIPQYDVNLLKDQILDDATGELISVVINDEETENQVNENSKDSSQSSSKNSHISSKGEENGQHSTENKDKSTDSSDVEEKDENSKHEEETNIESLLDDIKSLSGETSLSESPKQKINSVEKCNKSDDIKSLNTNSIVPNQSLSNDDKTDQVDGDLYNFTSGKDIVSLSESDSNNSSRTNPYMEDSDGNISIAGDTNDELADSESNVPKIVSVMSIADVLGGDFKSVEESAGTS